MQNVIWKKGIVIGIVLLFFGASIIPIIRADPVTIYVDDDNTTGPWLGTLEYPFWLIQDAIDAAFDGDTVYVFNGTYYGNIEVHTSIDLIGEDTQTTILDGNNNGHTVMVSANDVQITGFTVSNSGNEYPDSGIYLANVENTLITGTILSNNDGYGLFMSGGSLNTVENTTASFNGYAGIRIDSDMFTVANNTAENNGEDGIFLYDASQGLIQQNVIRYNSRYGVSIEGVSTLVTFEENQCSENQVYGVNVVGGCSEITIQNNTFSGNIGNQIYVDNADSLLIHHNIVTGGLEAGVVITVSSYSVITNNTIEAQVQDGLNIFASSECTIKGNQIKENEWAGIYIAASTLLTLIENTIENNVGNGILFDYDASGNTMYHNNFLNNGGNAVDNCVNTWDDGYPSGGNYWNDYTSLYPDAAEIDDSGIWDTAYEIYPYGSNFDQYPLMDPWMGTELPPPSLVYVDDDYDVSTPGWGYDHFNTIQNGVDGIEIGGVVTVYNGFYVENVVIDKSVQLYGEDRENTIVDGGDITNTIKITANNVVFNGFKVLNGNTVYPNAGVFLDYVQGSIINHNNISGNNGHGIFISWGSGNQVFDNILMNNRLPNIRIDGFDAHARIALNTIESSVTDSGIFLYTAHDVIIENNTISHNMIFGVTLQGDIDNVTIRHNVVSSNGLDGIMFNAPGVLVENNTISNNLQHGISLNGGNENTLIQNNVITENGLHGISSFSSPGIIVFNNTISGNHQVGIYLRDSGNAQVVDNTLSSDGIYVRNSYGNTVTGNTVNGKSLVYLEGMSSQTVGDAGQVVLVNCSWIVVDTLDLSDADVSLELWNTDNSTIVNNEIANNVLYGVVIANSSDNKFYHNAIINNLVYQVYIPTYASASHNLWNDSYPSGGNYWSSYVGVDANHGMNQDIPGSDGIGDTSYVINANNEDHYPFMQQEGWIINNPPYAPSNPAPSNASTGVPIATDLSWDGGDPDADDTILYDVYFGTTTPPVKVSENQSAMTYDPGTLAYSTLYYWKIVAWDDHGADTSGPIWSFSTTTIGWAVTVLSTNPGGQNDYVVFGEAPGAHDGPPADSYDVLKPPASIPPYIRTWLNDNLPSPFDTLMMDYRSYPDSSKVWNLTIHWMPSSGASPTTITVSWNIADFIGCEYSSVTLCTEGGTPLQNMLVNSAYVFSCPAYIPQNFKIICASSVSHTITATAGSGGSISPSGAVIVPQGSYKNFSITPDSGYHITGVLVDGSPVGAVSWYNFTNVQADHTISASFAQTVFSITATAGSGGSISPSGVVAVAQGGYKNFSISPVVSCHIIDVIVDGGSVGVRSWYNFTNVQGDHAIHAAFAINQYSISASAGSGGSIVPSGAVLVNYGGFKNFSITPDNGYHIAGVLVDGSPVGAVTYYNFTNVQADHTIAASFTINQYTLILTTSGTGVGTIQASPGPYYYGSTATIWANASVGSTFSGFTGSLTGTSSPQVLTFDGAESVDAAFTLNGPYTLTLTKSGTGSGTIQASPGPYYYGSTATIWANASTGSTFSGFTGSLTGSASPQVLTFDGAESVDAAFTLNGPYTLTLTKSGTGSGTIQASPGPYYYGSTATVWANASVGSTFSGFSGSLTGTSSPQVLTFDGAESVDATFTLNGPYTLTLTTSGTGVGTIQASVGPYYYGSTATIWANASTGSSFTGFTGSLTGTSSPQVLTFDGAESVDAAFTLNGPYTLTLTKSGTGSGTIQASPGPYYYGSTATVWANASVGSTFSGFSGSLTGTSSPQVLTFDGAESVDATFTLNGPYTLTLTTSGTGVGTIQASVGPYYYGSTATIWANASTGSTFSGFTGSLTGATSPQVLTFDSDESVDAGFSLNGPYTLTLSMSGSGSGTIQASPGLYYYGSTATVWANASVGSTFSGFTGSLTGTTTPQNLVFDGDESVDAGFTQNEYTLTISTVGSGSVVKVPDQVTYHYGDVVQLTASPDLGWTFSGWSGGLTGTTNPDTLTIDGDTVVTATFTQNEYTLTVSTVGSGLVDKNPDQATYHYGDGVQLTANADVGWSFNQWSGDISGSLNPATITFDGNKIVTATFTQNEYTLTVSTVGSGSVAKLPDMATYHYGDIVQLTANADFGWTFSQWSGDLSGSLNPASITIDGNKAVIATFTQNDYTLTVTTVGSGSVVKAPDQVTYHYSDVVQLTASADLGWTFAGWSGDLSGGLNPSSITIDGDKAVTATFTQNEYTLTVTTVGSGSVAKLPNQATYHYGDVVQLTASADVGWTFSGWSGDLTGTTNPDTLTIDGDTVVTATFTQNEYTLTVTTVGSGSVDKNPDQAAYHYGDVVQLTATADPNWIFSHWTGDLVGSSNPDTITINGDNIVTAVFTQNEYTLTITTVGQGSVTKNPDQLTYPSGTLVQLTASGNPGWAFSEWSQDLTGSTNPATITMDGDKTVTATFVQNEYTLAITTVGSGAVALVPDQATYHYGDVVQLTATGDPGWQFDQWSGDLTGSANPETITINGNKVVTATFIQIEYTLTITTVGSGTVAVVPAQTTYHYADVVQLTASADLGWTFSQWSDDLSGSLNPASITIDGNKAVTATFTQNEYTLAVTTVGSGSVAKIPDQGTYHYGDFVQLVATADLGWSFSEWGGDLTGVINPSTIMIDGDTAIVATFVQNEYTLTISIVGSGSVGKLPDQLTYHYGDVVVLTASADLGWTFNGWSGDLSGSVNPALITIDGNKAVTATFTQNEYTLTVTTVGSGSVTKNPDQVTYHYGDVVQLTSSADLGWTFTGWSGDLTGTTNPDTIIIDGNKDVTTTFTQDEYTLTLTTVGLGTITKDPDQATYHYGDVVLLTATADPSWTFSHWSGDLVGSTNPDSLTMTGDMNVEATFTQNEYTLTITIVGSGGVLKVPDQTTYPWGTVVQLTANADPGWHFDHWSGDLSGAINPTTITIDGDKAVTATFAQNEYTISFTTVGSGSVAKLPDTATYHYNDVVQLTATAELGWHFDQWSEDLTGSTNPATITMDGDKAVTATFVQNEYTLTISVVGGGAVAQVPDQTTYHYGDVVQLTADSDVGWSFSQWSGDLSGSLNPASVTIDGDKAVTATFTQNEYTLTVTTVGSGSVVKNPDQISYHYGDVVQLTASADLGWTFAGWSGDLTGTTNPEIITIDGDKSVTATFTQNEYTLSITTVGSGYVTKLPDKATYHYGDVAQLTATADLGWTFSGWSGDLTGTTNPDTLTIDENKAVTATFTQNEYTLDVSIVGSGSVLKVPNTTTYHYNEVVQLTATADLGWTFAEWSGDLTGTTNPMTITMGDNKAVTATFTENPPVNNPPVANAGPDQLVLVGALVQLSGAGSSDVDGDPLTFSWSFVSRPVGSVAVLSSAVVVNPSFVADKSGSYVVQLVVNDGTVDSSPDTVTISTINQPPYQPSNPVPSNGATDVALTTSLSWTGGDPELGDSVSYDVYFGPTNPPIKIISNQSATSYNPGTLTNGTQYYWKIVAWDNHGATTTGLVWSFTTTSNNVVWWNTDWMYRKVITIDHTKVQADLVNFPVLIGLGSDSSLAAHAQFTGNDIVFTDSSGIKLNHEVELYDGGTGHLVVWVNVTGLSSTIDTVLYLYYGNSMCGSQQNPQGTWNSQYLMVHHMNETGNIYDSTSHGLNAVNVGTSTEPNGKIDGCRYFDNSADRYYFGSNAALDPGMSSWTISLWTKIDHVDGYTMQRKLGSGDKAGYFIELYNGWGGHNYFQVGDGVKTTYRYWQTSWSDGNWHFITMVINRVTNKIDLYLDGVLNNGGGRGNISGFGSIATSEPFRLYGGSNGRHDEFCISTTVLDAGWIKTCYNNQNDPASFYSIGNEEQGSNQPPIVSNEMPQNGMGNINIHQASVSVFIEDPEGDPFDWTIEGNYLISAGQTGGSNGIKTASLITPLPPNTVIIWYVNATDPSGSGTWIHKTFSFTTQSVPSWWNLDWMYRKDITIDHTQVNADLVNFPVLISLGSDASLAAHAQPSGNDIVFTDAEGNKLNHEVELYDGGTGHLVVWVNVTGLSSTIDTVLYLYYGNSMCGSQQNPQGTWNSQYLMVHHMNETGNIYDSTSHGLNAVNVGTSTEPNGKIDGCRYFDNSADRYYFGSNAALDPGMSSWTISLWTKIDHVDGYTMQRKLGSGDKAGYFIELYNGWGGHNYFQVGDGVKTTYRYWQTSWSDGNWHFITMVINRVTNKIDLYLDGVLNNGGGRGNISGFGSIATSEPFRLYGGSNGRHDEFCISTTVLEADWIKTCYNNQNDPASFYSVGNEESG